MIITILLNIVFQLFCFIAAIYLGGYIIAQINRTFYGFFGFNRTVVYATGFIGTPIHESSHALMCLLFGHKIIKIKFFQMDDASGVLGYVQHSYNPKNIYARIGNYFIGVAPILMGCGLLCLLMYALIPNAFWTMSAVGVTMSGPNASLLYVWSGVIAFFEAFFSAVISWRFWVFLLLNGCIALHMNMSGADIKGTLTALPFLIGIIIALNLILGFAWGKGYAAYAGFMASAGVWIITILMIAIIFALFYLVVGWILHFFTGKSTRRSANAKKTKK